jgi:hypothetical protein
LGSNILLAHPDCISALLLVHCGHVLCRNCEGLPLARHFLLLWLCAAGYMICECMMLYIRLSGHVCRHRVAEALGPDVS